MRAIVTASAPVKTKRSGNGKLTDRDRGPPFVVPPRHSGRRRLRCVRVRPSPSIRPHHHTRTKPLGPVRSEITPLTEVYAGEHHSARLLAAAHAPGRHQLTF
jgi:hypothetical protein